MITVSQSGSFQGTGRAVTQITTGSFLGTNFTLGLTIPFYGGFELLPPQVIDRIYFGSRHTSKKKSLGMHDCIHQKFDGNLLCIPKVSFDVPADAVERQDYSSPSSHTIVSPDNGKYFVGREARAKRMWKTFSGSVSTKSPNKNPQAPFSSLPAWCCFSATAPNWQSWPDRDYASTIYTHFSYLGRRDDGVIVVGITEIRYNEIVRRYYPVSYEASATRRVIALSATGSQLRGVAFYQGKWTSSYGLESVSLSAEEARNIISSGTSLPYEAVGVPDYTILPRFSSNELFSGRISIDAFAPPYDRDGLEEYCRNLIPIVSSIDPRFVDDRELHDDLIDDVNFVDINSIAYLAEIKRVGDTFRSIRGALRGKINAEELSSLWLSLRYGDRLTISDSIDILHGLSRVSRRALGASRYKSLRVRRLNSFSSSHFDASFSVRTFQASSMYYKDAQLGSIGNIVRNFMNWDLWPSFKNGWDLIPLSFVVDWFVRVEDLARATDRRIQSQYYDIIAVCDGNKIEVEVPVKYLPTGFEGQLIWSRYTRRISNRLTFSPFRCDAGRPSDKNIVDGISLVIQASS